MALHDRYPFQGEPSAAERAWWDRLLADANRDTFRKADAVERVRAWRPVVAAMTPDQRAVFHVERLDLADRLRSAPGTGNAYSEERAAEMRLLDTWRRRVGLSRPAPREQPPIGAVGPSQEARRGPRGGPERPSPPLDAS